MTRSSRSAAHKTTKCRVGQDKLAMWRVKGPTGKFICERDELELDGESGARKDAVQGL